MQTNTVWTLSPNWKKVLYTILGLLGYTLIFWGLFEYFGRVIMVISIIPVLITSYFFGMWGGILVSFLFYPHTLFLLQNVVNTDFSTYNQTGLFLGSVALAVISSMITNLYQTSQRLKIELAARHTAEADLAYQVNVYNHVIDKASYAIILYNAAGRIDYMNPEAEKMSGYSLSDLKDRPFYKFVHPDYRRETLNYYVSQTEKGFEEWEYEFPVVTKSGNTIWVNQITNIIYKDDKPEQIQGIFRDITDKVNAKKILEDRVQRYQAFTENTSDIILVHDRHGVYVYASPSVGKFAGINSEDYIGKTPSDVIYKDDLEALSEMMANLRKMGEGASMATPQFRSITAVDGEYIYYEGTVTNMLHIPSVKGYLFIGREVTKQVLAEQALKENEERFRAITELHQDITIIVNNQLKAVYVSPSVQQLIGHQPEDLLGDMRNLELLPKDIDLIVRKTKSIVDRPGASVEIYSLKIKHKNGESLYFDAIGTNLFHIPSLKGIVFTARDVTDRIKTHREREASERRYQSLFNQTNDGIILYKPNGVVQSANQRAAEIFGGSVDDLIGREVKTLVDPEDVLDYQLKTELLLSNQSLPVFEQRIIHENGNTVPIEVNLALVKDADNNLLFIQAMFRDITLRKLTEDRLKHLATHDSLTGLPNRDVFYAQLRRAISRAKRENVKIAVLYIDLDDFKNVNDSLGHIYGDQLLKSFGDRLKENLRDYDTVARMGGDEFTVILDSVDTRDDAIDVAEKLAEKISKPFQLDKHKVVITCSIGIGIFPDDGDDAKDILIAADKEMYRYKQP